MYGIYVCIYLNVFLLTVVHVAASCSALYVPAVHCTVENVKYMRHVCMLRLGILYDACMMHVCMCMCRLGMLYDACIHMYMCTQVMVILFCTHIRVTYKQKHPYILTEVHI